MNKVSVSLKVEFAEMDWEGRETWRTTTVIIDDDQLRKLAWAMKEVDLEDD